MMRLIGIDRQMIAKDKTRILLYKDFIVSHNVPLRMLIYQGLTVFLILFP